MRYFKISKNLKDVLGEKAGSPTNMKKLGISINANMQMIVNDIIITYGQIINDSTFDLSKLNNNKDVLIFETLEEAESDIDGNYTDVFFLEDPVKLQLDLLLSKKDSIKGYDANLPIDDQFNLKKIKDDNMGGVKIISRKAKLK